MGHCCTRGSPIQTIKKLEEEEINEDILNYRPKNPNLEIKITQKARSVMPEYQQPTIDEIQNLMNGLNTSKSGMKNQITLLSQNSTKINQDPLFGSERHSSNGYIINKIESKEKIIYANRRENKDKTGNENRSIIIEKQSVFGSECNNNEFNKNYKEFSLYLNNIETEEKRKMMIKTIQMFSNQNQFIKLLELNKRGQNNEKRSLIKLIKIFRDKKFDKSEILKEIGILEKEAKEISTPFEYHHFLLRILNNNEAFSFNELPSYFEEKTSEISVYAIDTVTKKFKPYFDNFILQNFCLGTMTPFSVICSKKACPKKKFVSISCSAEIEITFCLRDKISGIDPYTEEPISKPKKTISDEIKEKYYTNSFDGTCQYCRTFNRNYRSAEKTFFINIPKYLVIKLMKEVSIDEFSLGVNIKIEDYSHINIGDTPFRLIGIIAFDEVKSISSFSMIQGEWIDNSNGNNISKSFEIEKAGILYFEKEII